LGVRRGGFQQVDAGPRGNVGEEISVMVWVEVAEGFEIEHVVCRSRPARVAIVTPTLPKKREEWGTEKDKGVKPSNPYVKD